MPELILLFLLFTKHFLYDYIFQTKNQWENKSKYADLAGIQHAFLHALVTFIILLFFSNPISFYLILCLATIEFVVHYHIDWARAYINKTMEWKADKDPEHWWFFGLDQYLHALTYITIAAFAVA